MDIPECPAVRDEMTFKSPFFPEDMLEIRTCVAGFSICPVVCTHHSFNTGIFDKSCDLLSILSHITVSLRMELLPTQDT